LFLVKLFADDTKIYRKIEDDHDVEELQRDLTRVCEWCDDWSMELNHSKCSTMTISKRPSNERVYHLAENGEQIECKRVTVEKDLGVLVDSSLTFRSHVESKVKKARQIVGVIFRTFHHLTPETFTLLFQVFGQTSPGICMCGLVTI
jgi:hypothetical protein